MEREAEMRRETRMGLLEAQKKGMIFHVAAHFTLKARREQLAAHAAGQRARVRARCAPSLQVTEKGPQDLDPLSLQSLLSLSLRPPSISTASPHPGRS